MGMMVAQATQTRLPAQTVADWLRDAIRSSRFVPGQRLVEADITQATGASRSKVREALQRLESEGLIQIEEFKGASVRRVSLEEVRQIYRARIALEGISARDFALNADAAARERLVSLMEQLDKAVEEGAANEFNRLNAEWHEQIVTGSGNALIAGLLERLHIPIQRLLFESLYDQERLISANVGHHEVVAAILAGNGDAAEAALRHHIEEGFATLSMIDSEFNAQASVAE
jgi:DNA-binding GntR family transcriptional regulator